MLPIPSGSVASWEKWATFIQETVKWFFLKGIIVEIGEPEFMGDTPEGPTLVRVKPMDTPEQTAKRCLDGIAYCLYARRSKSKGRLITMPPSGDIWRNTRKEIYETVAAVASGEGAVIAIEK